MNWLKKLIDKYDYKPKNDKHGFVYEPRLDDWVMIKGKWHHYITTPDAEYFNGVKIKDIETSNGICKYAISEEEVKELYFMGKIKRR